MIVFLDFGQGLGHLAQRLPLAGEELVQLLAAIVAPEEAGGVDGGGGQFLVQRQYALLAAHADLFIVGLLVLVQVTLRVRSVP